MKKKNLTLVLAVSMSLALLLALGYAVSFARPATHQAGGHVWSSGWVNIAPGEEKVFTHNLGGDPAMYAVRLWFRDTRSPGLGIHVRGFGALEIGGKYHGAYWRSLTDSTITVVRMQDDEMVSQVYVRIWIPDPPTYDSGWQDIAAGKAITLTPALAGDLDDYTVGMKFRSTSSPVDPGMHAWAFGGLDVNQHEKGAAWQRLTNNSVQVLRFNSDAYAEQVRVFISHPDPPSYDSGWQTIARGQTITFTHNLGGDPNEYVVRVAQQSSMFGRNSHGAGGLEMSGKYYGVNWQRLTNRTIQVRRFGNDVFADQVRARIWVQRRTIYLPLVLHSGQHPPTPTPTPAESELSYDDGTAESNQSYTTGNGFAVRFTPPGGGSKLVRARFYFIAPVAPIAVHVWDTNHSDLISPITATPTGDGWFDVDLSAANLTVNGDFYLGFLYTQDAAPTIGTDTSDPDGRSYEVPWEQKTGLDYMIRAVVSP